MSEKRLEPAGGGTPPRRFDPFRVLGPAERRRHLDAYRSWLEVRNGEPDVAARTLARREHYFAELAARPVAWRGPLDREGFAARFGGRSRRAIDARTLWLVAIAKANQGESYGVELELARALAGGAVSLPDSVQLQLFLEEQYHSRILVEACRTCGLDVAIQKPPRLMRVIVHLIYRLPDRLRWTLVLCGEVLGSTVFKLLRDHTALFAEQPEVEARLHSLVTEIWRDELLHVAWLRARLGPFALRCARLLLPAMARGLMRDVPQLVELGCDAQELLRRMYGGLELAPGLEWVEPDAAGGA